MERTYLQREMNILWKDHRNFNSHILICKLSIGKNVCKDEFSIGQIDIYDIQKKEAFESYCRKNVQNNKVKYKGLPQFFYKRELFATFASEHNMDILFSESV